MFEKKYEYIFLRKEYGTMNIIGFYKTNNLADIVRFKNRSYKVTMDKPAFSKIKTKVFIFDFDTGTQLIYNEIKPLLNPEEFDLIVSNHILKDLAQSAIADTREKIINMILGALIGGLLSALIMYIYMSNKIQAIYDSFSVMPILGA